MIHKYALSFPDSWVYCALTVLSFKRFTFRDTQVAFHAIGVLVQMEDDECVACIEHAQKYCSCEKD